jgi:hypothetical protein
MKKQKTQVDEVKSWLRKQNTKQLKTFCLFIEAVLKERHQKDEDKQKDRDKEKDEDKTSKNWKQLEIYF